MRLIAETRRVHLISYLHFYRMVSVIRQWTNISCSTFLLI